MNLYYIILQQQQQQQQHHQQHQHERRRLSSAEWRPLLSTLWLQGSKFLRHIMLLPPPPFTHTVFGDLIFYFFHNLWGAFIFSFPWGDLIFWGTCHFMFQFCVSQSYYLNPTWISCRCPTSYLRQRNYNHMWIVLLATWRRGQPTPTSCLHLKWNQHFCRNWKPTWAGSSMP